MIIFEKTIPIMTTVEEDKVFTDCYDIIDTIVDTLVQNECDEMIASETGEIITLDELCRMKGILSGLPIMSMMYSTK